MDLSSGGNLCDYIVTALSDIASGNQKKITERYANILKCTSLLSNRSVEVSLVDSEDWPGLLVNAGTIAVAESGDNARKYSDNGRLTRYDAVQLFVRLLQLQCQQVCPDVELEDIFGGLSECLTLYYEMRSATTGTSHMYREILGVILNVLSVYHFSDLRYNQQKSLYEQILKYLTNCLSDTSNAERCALLDILACICQCIHVSTLFSSTADVICRITNIAQSFRWTAKDTSRTSFVAVFNELIVNNGDRCREVLLERLQSMCLNCVSDLRIVVRPSMTIAGVGRFVSSPMKGEKVSESDRISDYSTALTSFIENYLILAYPDCCIDSYGSEFGAEIVKTTFEEFSNQMDDHMRRNLASETKFELPPAKLSLVARLVVLMDQLEASASQKLARSLAPKKKKGVTVLVDYASSTRFCHLQVIREVFERWPHRVSRENASAVAYELVRLDRKKLRKDDKQNLYLRTLAAVLTERRDLSKTDYEALWDWAVPLLHITGTHDAACAFLVAVLPYWNSFRTESPQDMLAFEFARFPYSEVALELLYTFVTTFDFDERTTIPIGPRIPVQTTAKLKWVFRSQLISCILEFADPNAFETAADLIAAIWSYEPNRWPRTFSRTAEKSKAEGLEIYLAERLGCSVGGKRTAKSRKIEDLDKLKENWITSLVASFPSAIAAAHQSTDDRKRHVFLFRMLYTFCAFDLKNSALSEAVRLVDDAVISHVLQNPKAILPSLELGKYWENVSEDVKIALRDFPEAESYCFHWDEDVSLSKAILQNPRIYESQRFNKILQSEVSRDLSFDDIALLLEKFGRLLTPKTVEVLIERLADEVKASEQLETAPEIIKQCCDRFVYVIFRYIDLTRINISGATALIFQIVQPSAIAAYVDLLPACALTDAIFSSVSYEVKSWQAASLLKSTTEEYKIGPVPTFVLKTVLKHPPELFNRCGCLNDEQLLLLAPTLLILLEDVESEDVKNAWMRRLTSTRHRDLIKAFETLNKKPEVELLVPGIVCLPEELINKVAQSTSSSLLRWSDKYKYVEFFFRIRTLLFYLRQRRLENPSGYPLVLLRGLSTVLKVYSSTDRVTAVKYAHFVDDLMAIAVILINDAVELRLSDSWMKTEILNFFKLVVDPLAVHPSLQLPIIDALMVRSMDTTTCELLYPETLSELFHRGFGDDAVKAYIELSRPLLGSFSEAAKLDGRLSILAMDGDKDRTLKNRIYQVKGYWRIEAEKAKAAGKAEKTGFLNTVAYFWATFPNLRRQLAEVLVFSGLSENGGLLGWTHDLEEPQLDAGKLSFDEVVKNLAEVLLFYSGITFVPSLTSALYHILCRTPLDMAAMMDFHDVHTPAEEPESSYCALALNKLGQFPEVDQALNALLPYAHHLPVYSYLLCRRLAALPAATTDRALSEAFVDVINQSCHAIYNEAAESQGRVSTFGSKDSDSQTLNSTETQAAEGLFTLDDVRLMLRVATELFTKTVAVEFGDRVDAKLLVKCLMKAGMFSEANYVIKFHIDSTITIERGLFAFQSTRSIVEAHANTEIPDLMASILIGIGDSDSLNQLPLHVRTQEKVRLFLAEKTGDWQTAINIADLTNDEDGKTEAFIAMGRLPIGNEFYKAVIKLAAWPDAAKDNNLLYPKMPKTFWEVIYGILIKMYSANGNRQSHGFLESATRKCTGSALLDVGLVNQIFTVQRLNLYRPLKKLSVAQTTGLPAFDSDVSCSFALANVGHLPDTAVVEAVVKRIRELRKQHRALMALKIVQMFDAHYRPKKSSISYPEIEYQRAKLLFATRDRDLAESILVRLSNARTDTPVIADVASRACKFLVRLQKTDAIRHLRKAVEISRDHRLPSHARNLVKLALVVENDYRELEDFMQTPAFKLKEECVTRLGPEVNAGPSKSMNDAEKREFHIKKAEVVNERRDIHDIQAKKQQHLLACTKLYIEAIANESTDQTLIYRVLALLTQNSSNDDLMELIKSRLATIPTNTWIPVIHILSSHICLNDLPISILARIIVRNVICDYPYHGLPAVLFYMASTVESDVCATRKKVMTDLIEECKRQNPEIKPAADFMPKAFRCFFELAIVPHDDTTFFEKLDDNKYQMNEMLRITRHVNKLINVPIPAITQPIFPPGDARNYDSRQFITIRDISLNIQIAGGLSRPKVVKFTGSDGKTYKLVFKAEDVRQDLLIQQLFALANLIMTQKNDRAELPLSSLPRYNVQPIDHRCGIIEWCLGTTAMCEYLCGSDYESGAHKKYRPADLSTLGARKRLHDQHRASASPSAEMFTSICQQIQPVLRHFFYDKFLMPTKYHEAIGRYARSLAQWSILCFVVGLGDRHLNNILIDTATGELVHIDLGMVFEFSKRALPIPERVPFRLTRDFVDPLIIDGIGGYFRRIAVRTMQLMRENAHVLVGIASVLIHDPVSTFAAVACDQRAIGERPRHMIAETAISRLKEKLDGRSLLTFTVMTPDEQVDRLIAEATDVDNLSKVFAGWMAFL